MNRIDCKHWFFIFALCFNWTLSTQSLAQAESKSVDTKKVHAAIKKMLNFALRKKNQESLKYIGVDTMVHMLLGHQEKNISSEQKEKFKELVKRNIELRAFPIVEEHFKSVDIPLEKPQVKNEQIWVKSSLLWGGSEQVNFTWILQKVDGQYVITDFLNSKGQSSMVQNQKKIQKMIETDGMDKLLSNFEEQLTKLKK